jgi:hypothetical protein
MTIDERIEALTHRVELMHQYHEYQRQSVAELKHTIDRQGKTIDRFVPQLKTTLTFLQKTQILELLWDYLEPDPQDSDCKLTVLGGKTKAGLIACIDNIIDGEA